jgi:hypothetical protein
VDRLVARFDYMDDDLAHEPLLVHYRGEWIDVWDVEHIGPNRLPMGSVLDTLAREGWSGWASESAWTGLAFRYLTGDDDGFTRIARVVWS